MTSVNQQIAVATLGPNAAAIKARVSPARWRKITQAATRKGFTIDSYLDPNTPTALKARTPKSLRQQAYSEVNRAYAPGEHQLDLQAGRIKAISDKRALDNQYYLDWLSSRHAQMAANAQAAESQLINAAGNIQGQTMQDYGAVEQRLKQGASAQPGNVSDPNQASAFNLTPEATRAIQQAGAEGNRTLDRVNQAQFQRSAQDANNFAFMASQEAKRVADTWQQLQGVADSRTKLELARGQDAAKRISQLLDGEITKANANRDYQAAADRLGIQQQNADTAYGRLQLGNKALNEKTQHDSGMLKVAQDKIALDGKKITLGWYKARHPHTSGGPANAQDPQSRFEYGYAILGSGSRTVVKGKKTVSAPIDAHYVGTHEAQMINQVQKAAKVTRQMATLIVRAFMVHNGADPGHYGDYIAHGVTPSGT